MQIQILSDLHLEFERQGSTLRREFYHYDIPVQAEYLALLGDIGCTIDDRLFDWLRVQLRLFKVIFFVSGNHGLSGSALALGTPLIFGTSRAISVIHCPYHHEVTSLCPSCYCL